MFKKNKQRLISAFLAVAMMTTFIPTTAFADTAVTESTENDGTTGSTAVVWDGTINTNWYNANDTQFTISTAAELAGLAELVNNGTNFSGKTITLNANIDLGGKEWTPIGTSGKPFSGTFEGSGKTISNLKITRGLDNIAENNCIGFFGASTNSAKIQNFTLKNVDVSGCLNVAAVLGGSGGAEAKIDNVHVTGNVQISGWWYVGGIMGKGYSTITNCSVEGDGTATSAVAITGGYAGGIVGFMGEGNCQTIGCTVKNITISGAYNGIGGINGILHYGNTIENCTAENIVVWQTTFPEEDDNGRIYCGAFAGTYLDNGGKTPPTLKGCTFTGELYNGTSKADILEATRYVGSLWYGAEPPATVTIENCTIKMPPVAQIGDKQYATLNEAVENASDGDTIIMLRDIVIENDIEINKNVTIDGQGKYTISGYTKLQSGTLKNLTLTTTSNALLMLGSTSENTIRMENVTVDYPVTGTSAGTVSLLSGNKADITISKSLFTNKAQNNGVTEGAEQWSYGLYMNDQANEGSFTMTESQFNGAFRTMLANINGSVTITKNTFANSIYSNNSGSTSGSGEEATCITTSKGDVSRISIINNQFDNAGAFYFQKSNGAIVTENTFNFDKFEHYIQLSGGAASPLDLSQNTFTTGENDLIIIDVTAAPVLLPAGQKAINYWAWADTDASVRPADYSSYVYTYNQDGSRTFYPESDAALNAFLNPATGNIGVTSNDTIEIHQNLTLSANAAIPSDATLVVDDNATLTISEGSTLTNNGTIVNPEKIVGDVTNGNTAAIKHSVQFQTTPTHAQVIVKDQAGITIDAVENTMYYLQDGTYTYTVSAQGYKDNSGTFTVEGKAQTLSVILSESSSGGGTVTPTPDPEEPSDSEETVTNPDGSTTTTITKEDGSSSTTTVGTDGKVESDVTISEEAVSNADGAAVALPIPEVPVTTDKDAAPTVTVNLPSKEATKVEVPVKDATPGTVAVLVDADGNETVIKDTVQSENGITIELTDGATIKIVDNSKSFDDVADNYWGADAIDFATSRELFAGTGENEFSPEGDMTRAMIWSVLARYEGADTSGASGDEWYAGPQQWAIENGISDGTMANSSMTREQLAAMLYRYSGSPAVSGTVGDYSDADSISSWASDAMVWAVQEGLIAGMGENTLNPQGTATRTQVAAILQRFIENKMA